MEATENDDSFTHAPAIKRRNPEVIGIEDPQKNSHADPPKDTHGLCLANPCHVGFCTVTGCSAWRRKWYTFGIEAKHTQKLVAGYPNGIVNCKQIIVVPFVAL